MNVLAELCVKITRPMKSRILILNVLCLACFLVSCSDHVTTILTGDKAKTDIQYDYPVVASATNFFYYEQAGGLQYLDRDMRFDVPKVDIAKQVDLITADNNRAFSRSLPYSKSSLSSGQIVYPEDQSVKLAWWHPEQIKNGFYVGENAGYAVQIWADTNSGTLYIHQED
jgi:hypothetical protein